MRHHLSKGRRILIIVPTTALVWQMSSDFKDYNKGKDLPFKTHKILEGASKNSDAEVVISTWQSIYNQKSSWYEQFDVIMGDEAHQYKAKSLIKIMTNTPKIKYKYGFSGTLDDAQTNRLTLEGLFGPVHQVTKTSQLIDDETLSKFKVKAISLRYPEETRFLNRKRTYHEEVDFLVTNEARNKFIRNLAWSLDGNTLILYTFVDKHGAVLDKMLRERDDVKVHFVHGKVDAEAREEVRRITEESTDNKILASYGTFSTGTNIKRLDNLILASPSKSKIRVLQSIGRVLRKSEHGDQATLFDIVDDLSWKKKENYAVQHFRKRLEIYTKEGFDFKIYNVDIKG